MARHNKPGTGSLGTRSVPKSVKTTLSKDSTVSVRKISNGFIVSESSFNSRTQTHNHKETFTKVAPKLTIT